MGEVVTPNYVQAQVLAVEGEGAALIWPREMLVTMQNLWITKGQHLQECIIQMFVGGVAKWDTLQEIVLLRTLNRPKLWVGCIIRWKQKPPIGRSLLNEFFNKLMRSERKQEIAKAKLKKARQQLNVQANPQQVQAGGGATATTPAQVTAVPAGPPAVTPPQANVPRKAQVGRPVRIAKPKPVSPAAVHGLFKSICRSGANLEKVLRIHRGAMQVYHHNQ